MLELDWKELLPENERSHFTPSLPPPVHDYRGEGGPPAVQTLDFNVNKSLEGATVRLPGFIVPLEPPCRDGLREFLLVPYFGVVHSRAAAAAESDRLRAHRQLRHRFDLRCLLDHRQAAPADRTTRLGATAYELSADKIEVYKY